MKMKSLSGIAAVACLVVSASAMAEQTKPVGSGPNPFADCGIGAALFPNTHWAAVSSNAIWDLGITAITSATASPETCSGKKRAAALFINDTYERLVEETAKGEGEHLTTVLNILECDSAQHPAAIQHTRSVMAEQISNSGYTEKSHLEKAADFYTAVSFSCSV